MRERQTCTDCGQKSPVTETNYTLIGKQHGWRMTRAVTPDGGFAVEWRCPVCWPKYKKGGPPDSQRKLATTPDSQKSGILQTAMNILRRSERPPRGE